MLGGCVWGGGSDCILDHKRDTNQNTEVTQRMKHLKALMTFSDTEWTMPFVVAWTCNSSDFQIK